MSLLRAASIALLVVALLAVVPSASAQSERITATEIQVATNPFLSAGNTLAREDSTFGFVTLTFCHGAGGLNPQEGTFDFTFAFSGNEPWFEVQVTTEPTLSVTPPRGPTFNQQQQCPPDLSLQWDLVATATKDAPYGAVGEIEVAITVAESGNMGTYQMPEGKTALMSVQIQSDPGEDIDRQLDNATRPNQRPTGAGGGGGESEDSPSPAFAVSALVVLGALLVAARRRA